MKYIIVDTEGTAKYAIEMLKRTNFEIVSAIKILVILLFLGKKNTLLLGY